MLGFPSINLQFAFKRVSIEMFHERGDYQNQQSRKMEVLKRYIDRMNHDSDSFIVNKSDNISSDIIGQNGY